MSIYLQVHPHVKLFELSRFPPEFTLSAAEGPE